MHETLVNINVDNQQRDYSLASSDAFDSIASPGIQADYVIRITTGTGSTRWTGNNLITLSWAKCPTTVSQSILPPEVLVCRIDGSGTSSISNVDPGENHTFSVETFLARSDEVYKGWIRATGLDDVTNKRVTHLLEVTLESAVVSGGATQYADVIGYTVFEVTDVDSNEVRFVPHARTPTRTPGPGRGARTLVLGRAEPSSVMASPPATRQRS